MTIGQTIKGLHKDGNTRKEILQYLMSRYGYSLGNAQKEITKVIGTVNTAKKGKSTSLVKKAKSKLVKKHTVSRAKNPVPKSSVAQAIDLYKRFRGEEPQFIDKVKIPSYPKAAIVIGECDGVMYVTRRDGQMEKYLHSFNKKSRPLLCSSPDGSQIFFVGGSYDFTEDGIVDRG